MHQGSDRQPEINGKVTGASNCALGSQSVHFPIPSGYFPYTNNDTDNANRNISVEKKVGG